MSDVVNPVLDLPSLQATFVSLIQPRLILHARIHFLEKCAQTKADHIAEAIALAWKWFLRLTQRGKDVRLFVSALADFAVRAFKSGRRVAGMEKPKDVLSKRAQQRHGFQVESLPVSTRSPCENRYSTVGGQKLQDTFEERLRDNTQTPVRDQATFRIDWPAWLNSRTDRDRRILNAMATGERTQNLARKFKVSPARTSQLRRECHADWQRFCGEGANEPAEAPVTAA